MRSGSVSRLPAKTREALARILPDVPVDLIESAAIRYQLHAIRLSPPAAAVRGALQTIGEQAGLLYVSLGTLSEEARGALVDALEPVGGAVFFEQAGFITQALMGLARNAALDVEVAAGRPGTPRHQLILSLSRLLSAHGYTADARPNGDLCFATREVLNALGESPTDVRALVRDALAKTA